jgi:mRNA interferase HigB
VRVIAKKMLQRFGRKHPDAQGPLLRWYNAVEDAEWADLSEVRAVFPHADQVRAASGRPVTIFNIGGNKYRLITAIHYNRQIVFVMRFYTHEQYDGVDWKGQL